MSPRRLAGLLILTVLLSAARVSQAQDDPWAEVLSEVAQSVVSLQLAQLRNFDDSEQGSSNATGFVVDAERGIVLTNRHVVGSGPIRLSATFQNQERVDAVPLYRDPIHDFAFLRYDPADLKYARPRSLSLRPDKVRTGMNVRVIGSDGGEQLSILTGTIARLDREVPSYGRYGYNDFNTFYLQAASSTSGGSSGSPVIDFAGDVVALNAAANTRTASSFFLPLQRIQYALERLQVGEPIARGGVQTLFRHLPFRELARLGLDAEIEQRVRSEEASNTGMLVVSQVIKGGSADGQLEEGDILISIAGRIITDFVELEGLLDDRIGERLVFALVRQGQRIERTIAVGDLNAIMPDRFVELGDSVLQNMSIQHARAMNRPRQGVVVMRSGYFFDQAGIPQGSVILAVDGRPVDDLEQLLDAIRGTAVDRRIVMRYLVPGREFVEQTAQVDIDNRWFDYRSCTRVDDARFWQCEPVQLARQPAVEPEHSVMVPPYKDPLLDRVAPAMVRVQFDIPYAADNVYARHFGGVGLVVDRQLGLVAVDRNTVPIGLGDARITLFDSLIVDASVVFLHPRHNVALLQYDTAQLQGADFEALELVDSDSLEQPLTMIGYRADGTFRLHPVSDISHVTVNFQAPRLARFQQTPLDLFVVNNVPPSLGGPLVDAQGRVHAMYMSFAYEEERKIHQREFAMPAEVIAEALRMYREGQPYYSLDVRLDYASLAQARELGLPDTWLERYAALDADERRVLMINHVVPATDAADQLITGDILLAIDGQLVAGLFNAERLSQHPRVALSVLRDGEVRDIQLETSTMTGLGTQRMVSWAGALFQAPHKEIGYYDGVDFPGVYIADTADGSPAIWDGLYRNRFVTEVDGVGVNTLDEFLGEVSARGQDEITRLTVVSMSGRRQLVTVEPEYNFWPTFEIVRDADGWERIDHLD